MENKFNRFGAEKKNIKQKNIEQPAWLPEFFFQHLKNNNIKFTHRFQDGLQHDIVFLGGRGTPGDGGHRAAPEGGKHAFCIYILTQFLIT